MQAIICGWCQKAVAFDTSGVGSDSPKAASAHTKQAISTAFFQNCW